jgi:hypothetical protein
MVGPPFGMKSNGGTMKNRGVGLVLILYSFLLGIGVFLNRTDKSLLIVGTAGALLSIVFGLSWIAGRGRKVWPILTLMAVGFVLLSHAVHAWFEVNAEGMRTPILLTVMLALTVGSLMRVAYSGMFSYAKPRELDPVKPHSEPAKARTS